MPRPLAALHTPSFALGACLIAAIERDTRGCPLSDAERFNYYPATPMAMISWVFSGQLHLIEDSGPDAAPVLGPALPRLTLSGPQRRPTTSWSPGPVHALSAGFYPEALSRLIGRSIEPYLDQTVPLQSVADPTFIGHCQAVLDTGSQAPFTTLQRMLDTLWQEPGCATQPPHLGDWLRALSTRAAHSHGGKSLRQLQRRIRDWTGQSYRDLQLYVRAEAAFARRQEMADAGPLDLASLAADAGFADQSHMGREIRRITGLSPARFGEHLAHDEAFWYYRLIADELRSHR